METLWQDLRYATRMLRRSPGFTIAAVLSLALGIGANTAIFTMINAMMLKALPVTEPAKLLLFTIHNDGAPSLNSSYPLFDRFRNDKKVFTDVMATAGAGRMIMAVTDGSANDQSSLVRAEQVSGNFFTTLGVNPVMGRVLTEDDDRQNDAHPVAVISYSFWRRNFGLKPDVIGKAITLNDFPFTIIGVAPPSFTGVELGSAPDLWYPVWMKMQFSRAPSTRTDTIMTSTTSWWLRVIGRLKPGVSARQAQSEMDGIFQQMLIEIAGPREANWTPTQRRNFFNRRVELQSVGPGFSYKLYEYARALRVLMTVVGLVLLIACANVANLLLARAATRQKEIAVRVSIGAGRLRLIRQLLTESVLLAALGGALGLIFSQLLTRVLMTYVSNGQTQMSLDLKPDPNVLGFTIIASLLTGILFGIAPALRTTSLDLISSLKESTGNVRLGRGRFGIDKALVVAQVALSLFLLIGAGLFVRSLQNLRSVDAGFEARNVLLFDLYAKPNYSPEQRASLARQILTRLEAIPGARSASLSSFSLLSGSGWTAAVSVPGYERQVDESMECNALAVGPRYFETMGIPVLMGRDFNQQDDNNGTRAGDQKDGQRAAVPVVVNQTMARYFFKNENPVGKRINYGAKNTATLEIVGVAKDAKYENLREKTPRTFYVPYFLTFNDPAFMTWAGTFQLRTVGNHVAGTVAIQQAINAIDKGAQALDIRTMESVIDVSLMQERFIAQVASFFSFFALLLAAMGLYGVLSYGVIRRTREMGIRMALGAQSGGVIWLVMRQSLVLVLIGVIIAIPAAVAATRLVTSYLFGLTNSDPITIAIATFVLLSASILAGYLPARRAARIDPMLALRYE